MYNIFPTILQLPISDLTAKAFPPSKRFLFLAWQGSETFRSTPVWAEVNVSVGAETSFQFSTFNLYKLPQQEYKPVYSACLSPPTCQL